MRAGSTPKPSTFKTPRVVDPLAPQYALPSVEVRPTTPPKFLRDSHDVSDIGGTRPRRLYTSTARPILDVSDIDGTHPTWQRSKRRGGDDASHRNPLDVRDITDVGFKTKRVTDPLRPTHIINGMKIADDDPKMRPKGVPNGRDAPDFSLTTCDIAGAFTGWRPPHLGIPTEKRRQWTKTNATEDIPGATTGTFKRTLRTTRQTDPNLRNYPPLDRNVRTPPDTPPALRAYRERLMDPREAEVRELRARIAALEAERQIAALQTEVKALREGGTASTPALPPRGHSAPRSASGSALQRSARSAVSGSASQRSGWSSRSARSDAIGRRVREIEAEVASVRSLPDTPTTQRSARSGRGM